MTLKYLLQIIPFCKKNTMLNLELIQSFFYEIFAGSKRITKIILNQF